MDVPIDPCCIDNDPLPQPLLNLTKVTLNEQMDDELYDSFFPGSTFFVIVLAIFMFIGFFIFFRIMIQFIIQCLRSHGPKIDSNTTPVAVYQVSTPTPQRPPRPFVGSSGCCSNQNQNEILLGPNSIPWVHDGVRVWWHNPAFQKSPGDYDRPPTYAEAIRQSPRPGNSTTEIETAKEVTSSTVHSA